MLVFILIGILRVKYSGKFCSPTFASLNFTLLAIFLHHVLLGWSCALELLKNELGIIKTCNLDLMWILRYIQTHMNFAWFSHILLHPLSSYTHIFQMACNFTIPVSYLSITHAILLHQTRCLSIEGFPWEVGFRGTIGAKWPKPAWKLQNQHFLGKTVEVIGGTSHFFFQYTVSTVMSTQKTFLCLK